MLNGPNSDRLTGLHETITLLFQTIFRPQSRRLFQSQQTMHRLFSNIIKT